MIAERTDVDLAVGLSRLVSDPEHSASLHETLGQFCHQSRNILNSLKLSLYLARRGGAPADGGVWSDLEPQYKAVERMYEQLQAVCRPMTITPIRVPLDALIEERRAAWADMLASRGRELTFLPPDQPSVGDFDPVQLGVGLDALVRWRAACGWPGRPAHFRWSTAERWFVVEWEEPHALAPERSEEACEDEILALPLLSRIIASHGGTVELVDGDQVSVKIRWPLDVPRPAVAALGR